MRPALKRTGGGIAGLLAALTVLWLFVFPFLTIRSPLAYPLLRRQWAPEAIVHFPDPVPEASQSTGFYFNSGAVQAATEMELRLRLKPDPYDREIARLKELPVTGDGRQFSNIFEKKHFWTRDFEESGFQIRVLHCRPTFYDDEPSWNHGHTYGYAWNDSTREVIYWTNSW
jgi:hypothetical protein